jgi:hypothetical protein
MSLDVYLTLPDNEPSIIPVPTEPAIFVRVDGQTKQISREEWDQLHPGTEPFTCTVAENPNEVFSSNITHNLNKMADAAGIYQPLWRPDEIGITKAHQLIGILAVGLTTLLGFPDKFKKFNPENGWGDYQGLVGFVTDYLNACQKWPNADVRVWR